MRTLGFMRVVVVRPDSHRANRWAARSLFDGLDAARARGVARMLDAFARYAHEQGLTPRRLTAEELFPAAPLPIYV